MSRRFFTKDPDGVKPFWFDFTRWLRDGENLLTAVVTADNGITVDSYVIEDNVKVNTVLSGGTVGTRYAVQCRITTTTTPARVTDKTLYVDVIQG